LLYHGSGVIIHRGVCRGILSEEEPVWGRMSGRVRDRSLKDEMRAAVQGDRERAEARRKAEDEGEYTGPAPPTLDLNKPTREWKLPAKEEAVAEEPIAEEPTEPLGEEPTEPLDDEPERGSTGFVERLRSLFR
jgi:hypothetical protein